MTIQSISESNTQLKQEILEIRQKATTPSGDQVFNIFSRSIELNAQINSLVNSQPNSEDLQSLQSSVQKTIKFAIKHIDSTCLTIEQKATLEAQDPYIHFSDVPSSIYSNSYPCQFEFGGKYYQNAESCYQAQKFTDQPKIMELFTLCKTAEEALDLAKEHPMTIDRQLSWQDTKQEHINKNDVMMHVLRAKFGQNPSLKNLLQETGSSYLVCHGNNPVLSDAFDGTGQNKFGTCLMRLRGEYGGQGNVLPNITYQIMTQELKLSAASPFSLTTEIAGEIFKKLDSKSFLACLCVNKPLNITTTRRISTITKEELEAICFSRLTIIDINTMYPKVSEEAANEMGLEVIDEVAEAMRGHEPPLKNFTLECMKAVSVLGPHVEHDEGLTLLTVGHTFNQLVQIAAGIGMTVNFCGQSTLEEHGEVPVQTDRILLTNNVILQSRGMSVSNQQALVKTLNCTLPTVQENVALCVFTLKIFNRCVYRQGVGDERWTFGRTSTQFDGYYLVVGGSAPARLQVNAYYYNDWNRAAGGRWKFLGAGH